MQEFVTPTVAVLIPTNRGDTKELRRAIDSVVKQEGIRLDAVTIVISSHSHDMPTADYNALQDLGEEIELEYDVRVIIDIHLGAKGIVYNLNRALRRILEQSDFLAEFIARLDDDDEWLPNKLRNQLEYMQKEHIDICGTQIVRVDPLGQELPTDGVRPYDNVVIKQSLIQGLNPFVHPSVVMRARVFNVLGGYEQLVDCAEDMHLWLRAAPHFTFGNLRTKEVKYTVKNNPKYNANKVKAMARGYALMYVQLGILNSSTWKFTCDG